MRIVICGFGRAAKALAEKILKSADDQLVGVLCRKESKNAGKDIGELLYGDVRIGISVTPINESKEKYRDQNVDVVIDFSNREMATPLIHFCGAIGANCVICTTNHAVEEISHFQSLANELGIGIIYAPNLTIGINLLMDFAAKIGKVLSDFNFEIIEKHPIDKAPPTMTARLIAQAINRENIPIHSVRLDGYVGVHEVLATNGAEKISIEHESFSRQAFANGAIEAARFIIEKKGLFLMKDVIDALEQKVLETTQTTEN